jgi:hypothetical protein
MDFLFGTCKAFPIFLKICLTKETVLFFRMTTVQHPHHCDSNKKEVNILSKYDCVDYILEQIDYSSIRWRNLNSHISVIERRCHPFNKRNVHSLAIVADNINLDTPQPSEEEKGEYSPVPT